jgi:hypothetical protein
MKMLLFILLVIAHFGDPSLNPLLVAGSGPRIPIWFKAIILYSLLQLREPPAQNEQGYFGRA